MANYRKRGDRWQVRVHGLPAKTFRTKRDAQTWARDQETAKERGGYVDRNGGKATVGEWWEAFQETSEWRNLRPTSKQGYSSVATRHVLPHLGQARLMDLRRGVIQAWVDSLDRSNSPQTACEAHKVLRRLLQAAVKRDLIGVNPALGITRPKGHRAATPHPDRG